MLFFMLHLKALNLKSLENEKFDILSKYYSNRSYNNYFRSTLTFLATREPARKVGVSKWPYGSDGRFYP